MEADSHGLVSQGTGVSQEITRERESEYQVVIFPKYLCTTILAAVSVRHSDTTNSTNTVASDVILVIL